MKSIMQPLLCLSPKVRGAYSATTAKIAAALLLLNTQAAHAANGWMTAITNGRELAQAGAITVVAVGTLLGLIAYLYGGKLLWDKGQSDRGDDIKTGRIIWIFVGGSVLLALAYFGVLTLETLGGSASDVGREI